MTMSSLPDLSGLQAAQNVIYRVLKPTPQIKWPLLSARCGCELWVKHENYNPTGAFKVRGGLVYIDELTRRDSSIDGVCAATRGNHGQSVAYAAVRNGLRAVIVVPEGNSEDKNRAMRAYGAELVVHGRDFDEALAFARELAVERGLHMMPSFGASLVRGVGTYALELFEETDGLDRVYVPVGLGSGICGVIAARNALKLDTEIIGVVSEKANCYERSFAAGRCTGTASADTLADGLAVRNPNEEAFAMMYPHVARIVAVSDDEVLAAMAYLFSDTHNVAEGAGAASLAALLKEKTRRRAEKTGIILTGGNVTADLFKQALDRAG